MRESGCFFVPCQDASVMLLMAEVAHVSKVTRRRRSNSMNGGPVPSESRIEVTTILSGSTQMGRVELDVSKVKLYDGKFQWSVEVAREIGRQLLEAAEAAEMEAMVVRFLQSPEFGLSLEQAARVVMALRAQRKAVSKESLRNNPFTSGLV